MLYPPTNWYRDMQLAIDVARSGGGPLGDDPLVAWRRGGGGGGGGGARPPADLPVYCAGPDVEYAASFELPRLGAGAFLVSLEACYAAAAGRPMSRVLFWQAARGDFRVRREDDPRAARRRGRRRTHIGDNPETDIKGALAAGGPWRAALVHTGMAVPGDDDGGAHLVGADAPRPCAPPSRLSTCVHRSRHVRLGSRSWCRIGEGSSARDRKGAEGG